MAALLRQWYDCGLLTNYVTQTSIAHLPREKFMEVPMPVPPLREQRAIAEALSDVDALLGALPRGVLAYDFADAATGEQKAVFDLARPSGIQEELSQPVAVLLNESSETIAIASQAG